MYGQLPNDNPTAICTFQSQPLIDLCLGQATNQSQATHLWHLCVEIYRRYSNIQAEGGKWNVLKCHLQMNKQCTSSLEAYVSSFQCRSSAPYLISVVWS
jgi:thiamine pyrophosphokinase